MNIKFALVCLAVLITLSIFLLAEPDYFVHRTDVPVQSTQASTDEYGTQIDILVWRHIDHETGVVCYTSQGGMSCLPINSLPLGALK